MSFLPQKMSAVEIRLNYKRECINKITWTDFERKFEFDGKNFVTQSKHDRIADHIADGFTLEFISNKLFLKSRGQPRNDVRIASACYNNVLYPIVTEEWKVFQLISADDLENGIRVFSDDDFKRIRNIKRDIKPRDYLVVITFASEEKGYYTLEIELSGYVIKQNLLGIQF